MHLRLFLVAQFHLILHANRSLGLHFLWTLWISETGTL